MGVQIGIAAPGRSDSICHSYPGTLLTQPLTRAGQAGPVHAQLGACYGLLWLEKHRGKKREFTQTEVGTADTGCIF